MRAGVVVVGGLVYLFELGLRLRHDGGVVFCGL